MLPQKSNLSTITHYFVTYLWERFCGVRLQKISFPDVFFRWQGCRLSVHILSSLLCRSRQVSTALSWSPPMVLSGPAERAATAAWASGTQTTNQRSRSWLLSRTVPSRRCRRPRAQMATRWPSLRRVRCSAGVTVIMANWVTGTAQHRNTLNLSRGHYRGRYGFTWHMVFYWHGAYSCSLFF